MKTLNLGILAHVDAGKTSLTERLLYTAGAIDEIGSVNKGNTQTDSLALERQRGITIKSAVASFVINDTKINLIDTPGHPDFIAEVERVLDVLDGAVLVISAVEGVQPQTRVLMRTLQRLRIPALLFVNKIDRSGARYDGLLQDIAEKLAADIVPMGSVRNLGTPAAGYISSGTSRDSLAGQTQRALAHPVFFGSAITGAGINELFATIPELLPTAKGNADEPVSATVFKIERDRKHERIAYVRMFSGTIRVRDTVHFGKNQQGKVTAIHMFDRGAAAQRPVITAGEIGRLKGLTDVRIDDAIGAPHAASDEHHFAPPTLETVIAPLQASDKGRLRAALDQLAEQDPLINLRQDDVRNELFVSLYGEVQKEVIQETLAADFGLAVSFRETRPICVERVAGVGHAVALLQEESNPTSATIGLRIEPGPIESGVTFRLDVNPQAIPLYIYKTTGSFAEHMTQYINDALKTGLSSWRVTDCVVTMDACDYYVGDGPGKPLSDTPKTTAADFRKLAPVVLRGALRQADTVICEPICRFELEVPISSLGPTLAELVKRGAVTETSKTRDASQILRGRIPAVEVSKLQQQLPALASGEGLLEYNFDHYEPARTRQN